MGEVVIPASGTQSAVLIFLHGLGDSGHGWSSVFEQEIRHPHIKYICPSAAPRPVTLNMGMRMPAWFDLFGLTPDSPEDVQGIEESARLVHAMIDREVNAGTPPERIIVGGFSMGGALALYAGFTYPRKLAGIVGLSSFLVQRDKLPGNHQANLQTPVFLGHGTNDFLVPVTFGQLTEMKIKTFDPNVRLTVYPGLAHSSCEQELRDVKVFIQQYLPPK